MAREIRAALLAQNLSTWPVLAMCYKGGFVVKPALWLSLLRFATCAVLAFPVTAERMNMQSTA